MNKKLPVRYNDQVGRILLCVLAAFLVAMYGTGARFLDSLTSGSFYIKLIAVFLMACFFIEFIHWITVHLDRSYDWKEKPIFRLILQFSLGMVVPGIIDFFFLSLYQWYFGLTTAKEILSTQSAMPIMIIPVFLFNVYYLLYYQVLRTKEEKEVSKKDQTLLIQQGTKTIPIQLDNIRFIYHQDRLNYLVTLQETTYFLNDTLEELENQLPRDSFFRVNRKMIIHHRACQHFRTNGHGKLILTLNPPFSEEVTISQNKAASFREWIKK
ncbi:LytR/AlgR family response regulator transcription factor [Algoriphagus terrigena]|uniref:LytR/AlgR family response regulator transcription factor n=1 Tax=Algoriphagus terrigena TaxID=344884 RepID=UPI0012F9AE1E|nr:LytTR family DNA-binding domain-containing protein [Algoriphagus terrigena]